jgi:hypothetical protein
MAMVCPQCNASFDQRLQCPTCNVRLIYQHSSQSSRAGAGEGGGRWQQTPWGRILVGLLLAQGLYYGLRHLFTAGLLVTREDTPLNVWATLYGLIFLQGMQAFGLLVGGALAGAGKRHGLIYGAVVGIWNGVISVLVQPDQAHALTAVTLYGQPVLQTAFGAVGGLLGMLIWKPLPRYEPLAVPRGKLPPPRPNGPSVFAGPIAWGRVLAGVAVAVGGTIWANTLLDMVMEASEGKLTISTHLQAQLVTWEITTLAILVGSSLAGANTNNGLKQGLCVGLGAAAVLLGLRIGAQQAPSVEQLVYTAATTLAVALLGGWFGGSLFPPLVQRKRLAMI